MLAMPGVRAFSLAARGRGVSCDGDGVFVSDVALLVRKQNPYSAGVWSVRPTEELNDGLTALYRLPIDVPRVLTLDRLGAEADRAAATSGMPKVPGCIWTNILLPCSRKAVRAPAFEQ